MKDVRRCDMVLEKEDIISGLGYPLETVNQHLLSRASLKFRKTPGYFPCFLQIDYKSSNKQANARNFQHKNNYGMPDELM